MTQRTINSTICVHGWTSTIRPTVSYTNRLKLVQMRQYHETGSPSRYEEDHLIPLELGGHPTSPKNLWPEPHPRADAVDQIETALKRQVCRGTLGPVTQFSGHYWCDYGHDGVYAPSVPISDASGTGPYRPGASGFLPKGDNPLTNTLIDQVSIQCVA